MHHVWVAVFSRVVINLFTFGIIIFYFIVIIKLLPFQPVSCFFSFFHFSSTSRWEESGGGSE